MVINNLINRKKTSKRTNILSGIIDELFKNRDLYLMAIPAVTLLFLFSYLPLGGLLIAFKDYQFQDGIFGSKWMNPLFKNFEILFKDNPNAFRAIKNTLFLNALFITFGTTASLTLALLFNEVRGKVFKKVTQSITFLPFFISWIVVGLFVTGLLGYETGTINHLLDFLGLGKIHFYSEAKLWPSIMVIVSIWKGAGYGAVIYLATISGIDSSYYEAAQIDGATRWQQMKFISLPLLRPTVVILTLLSVGKIMNADFGMFFSVTADTTLLYPTTDVIDTFIYRGLRQTGDIGISSATGFFQSVVSAILVLISNTLVNIFEKDAALF